MVTDCIAISCPSPAAGSAQSYYAVQGCVGTVVVPVQCEAAFVPEPSLASASLALLIVLACLLRANRKGAA